MTAPTTGRSIRCEQCGSIFSVADLRPRSSEAFSQAHTCPFCSHRQSLADVHAELESYERDVEERADSASTQQELADRYSRVKSADKSLLVAGLLFFGIPSIGLATVLLLMSFGTISWQGTYEFLLDGSRSSPLYVGLFVFLAVAYAFWHFFPRGVRPGRRDVRELLGEQEIEVACPSCGAPGALRPGQAVEACAYCEAALVPSTQAARLGLDAAQHAEVKARLERCREGRRALARTSSPWLYIGTLSVVVVLGVFSPWVVWLCWGTWQMLFRETALKAWIAIPWALLFGSLLGIYYYASFLRQRRRTIVGALSGIAHQFNGEVFLHHRDRVTWLNEYWTDETEVHAFDGHFIGASAAVSTRGFPTLLIVDSKQLKVFVAAWVPGLSDAGGRHRPELPEEGQKANGILTAKGFHTRISAAGLYMSMSERNVEDIHRAKALSRELTTALPLAAQILESARARSAPRIPDWTS